MIFKKITLVTTCLTLAVLAACGDKQEVEKGTSAVSSGSTSESSNASPSPMSSDDARRSQQSSAQQPPASDKDGLTRVRFDQLFAVDSNGNLTPKIPVDINGVQMTPGVTFGGGVQFGGFALSQALGHDFGVRRIESGYVQLVKYYD
ncbi:hypothetical protein [Caballeronia novacaledonica]|uniref:Lipoprotein n=1 Tax=Caballeronia novacaledonica TaxID=1544861 RepID=A0AA37IAY2_9BURK|nr:hypothetical protein [Caballeronia novacaledonica]GJH25864.1 hypothetical protein CBA19CS42_15130 [Caballeronia novacaledonica]